MSDLAAASNGDLRSRLARSVEEAEALREELYKAQQLATLGTLTAGIAHEINNILTPVLAYAQLARSNPHDTALWAKAMERTIAGVESASRITEAVLGFARGDGETTDHCDLAEVVSSALACMGRDPAREGVRLVVDVADGLEVRIPLLSLQQVLLNLVLNAMTALKKTRGGTLRIAAVPVDGNSTRISVEDTGTGIPPELLPRLFNPFVTGARRGADGHQRPRGPGGTGLGLAVCKRLIENAGGKIEVASVPGEGATFSITLNNADHDRSSNFGTVSKKKAS